jgi:phage terminase Nu1 subunit (DNA packaging protein)
MQQSGLVSVKVVAKFLELTPRRIQDLAKRGILPKASRGQYEFLPTVKAYIQYLQGIVQGKVDESTDENYRQQYNKFRAERERLEVMRLKEELLPADQVASAWAKETIAFKTKMRAIPTSIAQRVLSATSLHEVQEVLTLAIKEACDELSQDK